MLLPATMFAGAIEKKDTIIHIEHPDCVSVITEGDSVTHIDIYGQKGAPNYHYRFTQHTNASSYMLDEEAEKVDFNFFHNKRNKQKSRIEFNILSDAYIGAFAPVDLTGDLQLQLGCEYGCKMVEAEFKMPSGKHFLAIGVGIEKSMLKLHGGRLWNHNAETGADETLPYPEGSRKGKSWLHYSSITLPLHYDFNLKGRTTIGLFAVPKYTFKSFAKNSYKTPDGKLKTRPRNFNTRSFSADFGINLSNNDFGVYIKYNPFSIFESNNAYNFKCLTIGIAL